MEDNEENIIRLDVPAKTYIKYYLKKHGYPLLQPCHGKGECAECLIRVVKGELPPSLSDILRLDEKTLGKGYRLGCKAVTITPITIELNAGQVKRRGEHTHRFTRLFAHKN